MISLARGAPHGDIGHQRQPATRGSRPPDFSTSSDGADLDRRGAATGRHRQVPSGGDCIGAWRSSGQIVPGLHHSASVQNGLFQPAPGRRSKPQQRRSPQRAAPMRGRAGDTEDLRSPPRRAGSVHEAGDQFAINKYRSC
jgi:hypothetical protein